MYLPTTLVLVFAQILLAAEIPSFRQSKNINHGILPFGLTRITGGNEATPHSFPYQAALKVFFGNGQSALCGGSLISNEYVLTAAHCVDGLTSVDVLLGAHRMNQPEDERITFNINSKYVTIHENWDSRQIRNDIALIKLSTPVNFTNNISPISLPKKTDVKKKFAGQTATASGWGVFSDVLGSVSPVLRSANVTIIKQNQCSQRFGSIIQPSNICTSGAGGKSTCSGDSGGPLVAYEEDGSKVLVGITSFGSGWGCERNYPAVFTRVTSFLGWIAKKTGVQLRE